MNARFLTNAILTFCLICTAGILLLTFFVVDRWHAGKKQITAYVWMKGVDTTEKKLFSRYQPTAAKNGDSVLPNKTNRYYLHIVIAADTLLMPVTKTVYAKKQAGDTILLLKAVGRFTGRVFYVVEE
jgi:hypothetical protein